MLVKPAQGLAQCIHNKSGETRKKEIQGESWNKKPPLGPANLKVFFYWLVNKET